MIPPRLGFIVEDKISELSCILCTVFTYMCIVLSPGPIPSFHCCVLKIEKTGEPGDMTRLHVSIGISLFRWFGNNSICHHLTLESGPGKLL